MAHRLFHAAAESAMVSLYAGLTVSDCVCCLSVYTLTQCCYNYTDIKMLLVRMVYVCVCGWALVSRQTISSSDKSPVSACVLLALCHRCCLVPLPRLLSCSSSNCLSNHCQKSASSPHPTSLLVPTCLPTQSTISRYKLLRR